MIYLILAIAIVLNAAANILIKLGMQNPPDFSGFTIPRYFVYFISNFYILGGVASFGLALLSYSFVLSKMNLSVAYPIMTSVGFIFVVMFSILFLGEKLIPVQILGILLILAGVWLVASFR